MYYDVYEPIFLNKKKSIHIGNRENKTCRFCGKRAPEVRFRNKSHAFSKFLGNDILYSHEECDSCNKKFSKFERHLANLTIPIRAASAVPGITSQPNYTHPYYPRNRITHENGQKKIFSCIKYPMAETNIEKKLSILRMVSYPYVPRLAYKSLVKMALSILPYEELEFFEETFHWLSLDDTTEKLVETSSFRCISSFYPGPLPFDFVVAFLARRKEDSLIVPYMTFFLATGNISFQIHIPLSSKDNHLIGQEISLFLFPTIYDSVTRATGISRDFIDLSSMVQETDHEVTVEISSERVNVKEVERNSL